VTASPAGIPGGTGLSGHIIVSAPATQQVITIPVGIVVGSLYDKPTGFEPSQLYVPVVERQGTGW
jgi:hypothetical protein